MDALTYEFAGYSPSLHLLFQHDYQECPPISVLLVSLINYVVVLISTEALHLLGFSSLGQPGSAWARLCTAQ